MVSWMPTKNISAKWVGLLVPFFRWVSGLIETNDSIMWCRRSNLWIFGMTKPESSVPVLHKHSLGTTGPLSGSQGLCWLSCLPRGSASRVAWWGLSRVLSFIQFMEYQWSPLTKRVEVRITPAFWGCLCKHQFVVRVFWDPLGLFPCISGP